MKAIVLLGVALAAPAIAQTEGTLPPEEAAKLALETCIEHSRSATPIDVSNAAILEAKSLKYQRDPPEFLASTKSSTLGIAQYARVPSNTGEIWAVGYDSAGCMVVALAAPVAEVEKGFDSYFDESKIWRAERAPSSGNAGERLKRYAANPRRNLKLTATVNLRDEADTATITIVRSNR